MCEGNSGRRCKPLVSLSTGYRLYCTGTSHGRYGFSKAKCPCIFYKRRSWSYSHSRSEWNWFYKSPETYPEVHYKQKLAGIAICLFIIWYRSEWKSILNIKGDQRIRQIKHWIYYYVSCIILRYIIHPYGSDLNFHKYHKSICDKPKSFSLKNYVTSNGCDTIRILNVSIIIYLYSLYSDICCACSCK